jgi:hypothetical protein
MMAAPLIIAAAGIWTLIPAAASTALGDLARLALTKGLV